MLSCKQYCVHILTSSLKAIIRHLQESLFSDSEYNNKNNTFNLRRLSDYSRSPYINKQTQNLLRTTNQAAPRHWKHERLTCKRTQTSENTEININMENTNYAL